MTDKSISEDWPIPNAVTYVEVADRLRLMAVQALDREAAQQFEQLAELYDKLASVSLRYRESPTDSPMTAADSAAKGLH
jgi:hypothetical protein